MLVLSRKLNEKIVFPGLNIEVSVVSVGSGRVQVGIEAPREIQITRPDAGVSPSRPAGSRPPQLAASGC